MALGFDKNRPTGFETAQGIVQTTGYRNEFGRDSAIEIRPPEPCRPLKGSVLVQDDSLIDQRSPGQEVGQARV